MVKQVRRTGKHWSGGTWGLLPCRVFIQTAHPKLPSTERRIFGAELSPTRIKARTLIGKLRKCRLFEQPGLFPELSNN
jgi:hypothetical protein